MRRSLPFPTPRRARTALVANAGRRSPGTSPRGGLVVTLAATLLLVTSLMSVPSTPARAAEPGGGESPDAHAGAIDLTPYAGKVVYVDFWASWCVPCRASFPWMNALQVELADEGFVVIGVNTGDTPEAAARFLEKVPAEFTLMEDPDGSIARAYGLTGMPMAYVHDRSGELVAAHAGFDERTAERHAESLREFVREGP